MILTHESGARRISLVEKKEGQKSRGTISLNVVIFCSSMKTVTTIPDISKSPRCFQAQILFLRHLVSSYGNHKWVS
jgi:hypothetical protein